MGEVPTLPLVPRTAAVPHTSLSHKNMEAAKESYPRQEEVDLVRLKYGGKVCYLEHWCGMIRQEGNDVVKRTVIITDVGRTVTTRRQDVSKTYGVTVEI